MELSTGAPRVWKKSRNATTSASGDSFTESVDLLQTVERSKKCSVVHEKAITLGCRNHHMGVGCRGWAKDEEDSRLVYLLSEIDDADHLQNDEVVATHSTGVATHSTGVATHSIGVANHATVQPWKYFELMQKNNQHHHRELDRCSNSRFLYDLREADDVTSGTSMVTSTGSETRPRSPDRHSSDDRTRLYITGTDQGGTSEKETRKWRPRGLDREPRDGALFAATVGGAPYKRRRTFTWFSCCRRHKHHRHHLQQPQPNRERSSAATEEDRIIEVYKSNHATSGELSVAGTLMPTEYDNDGLTTGSSIVGRSRLLRRGAGGWGRRKRSTDEWKRVRHSLFFCSIITGIIVGLVGISAGFIIWRPFATLS